MRGFKEKIFSVASQRERIGEIVRAKPMLPARWRRVNGI
jgi:hypothetical protein